ncbi:MAG: imelysin family protein [Pseudomonadota bacterium]
MKLKLTTALGTALLAAAPAFADKAAVLDNYANIALAKYEDSLTTATMLQTAVESLVASPSAEALQAAKEAWLNSRVPYQQTEVYRFGNAIVDDWEGKVNAWPLDEGLIDYVDESYGGDIGENTFRTLNVVATPSFTLSGETIDASVITPALLEESLHEVDEVEANVATGYHAIEFLLWGQDLNGHGPGAGNRPWTDYASGDACTGGNCDRRAAYLQAATALLVSDLEWMVSQWQGDGEARIQLTADENAGINTIFTGMGSLSYGEQAGERMKLGVMLNDPEEEHDCFSDNTHNSHFYDAMGIRNVYLGSYTRIDGTVVSGASLSGLVSEASAEADADLTAKLNATMLEMSEMKTAAEAGFAYDMMLELGNEEGEALIMGAVDALVAQTRAIERAMAAMDVAAIEFEGSDSLDNPDAVFQ